MDKTALMSGQAGGGGAPSVSVIVPTYNRSRLLVECVRTLVEQTVPPLEIIIVDDGSSDDTATAVRSLPGPVRYVRKANGGKSVAVNLGLSLAQGDIIWFFDDDDWAEPDAIEQRLKVLSNRPELGFVGAGHFLGHADARGGRVISARRHMPAHPVDVVHLRLFEDCFFSLCSVLARRTCYEAVGGFDPKLKSSEDYDVLLRLASHFQFDVLDVPVFTVRQHDGVRGAGEAIYQAHQRREVFRRSDRVIGVKLRSGLPLSGYLALPAPVDDLNQAQIVQAYLSRAVVMASKGLIDDMFEDLLAVASLSEIRLASSHLLRARGALMCDYAFDAVQEMGPVFRQRWRELRALGPVGMQLAQTLRHALWLMARMRTPMPWSERFAKFAAWVALFRR